MSNNIETVVAKEVKLKRVFPEGVQAQFVDHFVIQHRPDHYILTFYDVMMPPIVAEDEEEFQELVDKLEEIEARCVARLVLTHRGMKAFYEALSSNVLKHLLSLEVESENEEDFDELYDEAYAEAMELKKVLS
jgi:hypothetical protein